MEKVKDQEFQSVTNQEGLNEIRTNISTWDVLRNQKGKDYLSSGFGIKITKNDFEQLDAKSEFINLYIGVEDVEEPYINNTWFYLVDSDIDKANNYYSGSRLLILSKQFDSNLGDTFDEVFNASTGENSTEPHNSITGSITKEEAKERSDRWTNRIDQDIWFNTVKNRILVSGNQIENCDLSIVRVFSIPRTDFTTLLETFQCEEVIVFFGLKDFYKDNYTGSDGAKSYNIEAILGGFSTNGEEKFMDVSTPHPPFSIQGGVFNLL